MADTLRCDSQCFFFLFSSVLSISERCWTERRLNSKRRSKGTLVYVKNLQIYKTIIVPVVSYGCETWFLTQRAEQTVSLFENRLLRRVFGPKMEEVAEEDCIMRSFITCTRHHILLR